MPRLQLDDNQRGPVARAAFGAAVVLGAVAVWLIVTASTQKGVEIGVLVGLWGLLLASYSVFGSRQAHREESEVRRDIDVRPHGVVDTREAAAERRAYEYRLEEMLRRQIQAAMASEVASLRSEVSALRSDFIEKVGGQLRLERIETTRLIGSNLEALQHEVRQVASAHPTVDAETYSVPAASYHDVPAESGYPAALDSPAPREPAPTEAQYSDSWFTSASPRVGEAGTPAAPPLFESPAAAAPLWDPAPPPYQQPTPVFQPNLVVFEEPTPLFQDSTTSFQPATPLFDAPSPEPSWDAQTSATHSWQPAPSATPPLFEPSTPLFDASTPLFDAASAASTPLFESFLNTTSTPEPKPEPAAPADPFADMPRLTRFTDVDAEAGTPASPGSPGYGTNGNSMNGHHAETVNGWHPASNGNGVAPASPGGRRRREADDADDTLSRIFRREGLARG